MERPCCLQETRGIKQMPEPHWDKIIIMVVYTLGLITYSPIHNTAIAEIFHWNDIDFLHYECKKSVS